MVDVHGNETTGLVLVPELGLGDMRGHNLWFTWRPRGQHPSQIDAILAPDILRRYDVEIDFANKKFELFSPEHCAGRVVYWAANYNSVAASIVGGGHIEIPIILDGKEIRAIIDTGASVTALSKSHAFRLFDIDDSSPGVEQIPGATPSSLMRYRYRFKQLSFGGVNVSNPLVVILPDIARERLQTETGKLANDPVNGPSIDVPAVILGLDILRKLHLYVAYNEQRVYLTAADAGVPASLATTESKASPGGQ